MVVVVVFILLPQPLSHSGQEVPWVVSILNTEGRNCTNGLGRQDWLFLGTLDQAFQISFQA